MTMSMILLQDLVPFFQVHLEKREKDAIEESLKSEQRIKQCEEINQQLKVPSSM